MTKKQGNNDVADLTQLALAGTQFAIVLTQQTGSDWTFKSIAFNSCYFTSISPSNVATLRRSI